jgi:cytochrome P450
MARSVLQPVSFDVGGAAYDLEPGMLVATLLPLLNTTAGPGLDVWDPDRWARWRLADTSGLASPELVTAFGHGRHTCPAQPFSLSAMTKAVTHLFGAFDVTPRWSAYPHPVPAQIGGVARAAGPAEVDYAART